MSAVTIRERLDYLVQTTGRPEAEIVAQAVDAGLTNMYRKRVADTYLAGELTREGACEALGEDAVAELDYARQAIEEDVAWGLAGD